MKIIQICDSTVNHKNSQHFIKINIIVYIDYKWNEKSHSEGLKINWDHK